MGKKPDAKPEGDQTPFGALRRAIVNGEPVQLYWPRIAHNSLIFVSLTDQIRSGIDFVLDGAIVAHHHFDLAQKNEFDKV